jgi:hypothetical protein
MNAEECLSYSNAIFQGIPIVNQYIKERVMPLLAGLTNPQEREARLLGLYQRAFLWMRSLEKLSAPQDFQAIVTGNRALFEVTVDMILVAEGGPSYAPERMHWWEQSAKLKAAEAIIRYYSEAGLNVPNIYQFQQDFIMRNKTIVEQQRQALWNRPSHPERWTNSSLEVDARRADEFRSDDVQEELESSLLEFYQTQIRRMHLSVHGSGLANERYLDREGFYIMAGLSYKWSTDFALFCTKLILREYGFSEHLPELADEWRHLKAERLLIFDQYRPNIADATAENFAEKP